jgi:4-diphosphocytidyl-2-C-methyl-D-erythritol kinase
VIVFPNCKINLGLSITGKREDGYHGIETIFFPVPLKDALEIVPAANNITSVHIHGLSINGNATDNLCMKAYDSIKKDFPELPALEIHLLKKIPTGAGLGGGSSNGSFMLRLLNDQFQLNLSVTRLLEYALKLGSDCPFFINNTACYATGRGELMEPVSLNLSGYALVLHHPGIHVNTGWAFSRLQVPEGGQASGQVKQIIQEPVKSWKETLINDFEKPVFEQFPALADLKANFYRRGAVYAAMSGSGSTVFGLFENERFKKNDAGKGDIVINL